MKAGGETLSMASKTRSCCFNIGNIENGCLKLFLFSNTAPLSLFCSYQKYPYHQDITIHPGCWWHSCGGDLMPRLSHTTKIKIPSNSCRYECKNKHLFKQHGEGLELKLSCQRSWLAPPTMLKQVIVAVISTLGRWVETEGSEVHIILSCVGSSRLAWAIQDPASKNKTKFSR